MTKSQRQHGIASLKPDEKIVGKPGGLVEPGVKQYGIFKKIKKGLKKVFKSPLGKAALIGGGLYGLNRFGIGSSGMGKNWWSKAMGKGPGKFLSGAIMGKPTGQMAAGQTGARTGGIWNWMKGNPGKAAMIGAGIAGSALPFMGGGEEEDEVMDDWSVTPSSIANIRNMARNRDSSLAFMPPSDYVQSGFFTGAKDGGIIGLANGGQPAEAQAEQMLKMEYQKYRNQGGTLSYQEFKMQVMQQAQGSEAQGQPQMAAQGGRIGYNRGRVVNPGGYAGEEFDEEFEVPTFSEGVNQEFPEDGQGAINVNEEQMAMISDMNDKGMDTSLISTISGTDENIVIRVLQLLNSKDVEKIGNAQGGRIGYENGELVTDESMVEATPAGMMEENVEEVQGEPTREQMELLAKEIFNLRLEELDEEQLMVVYQTAMEQQPEEMAMQEEIEFNPQMAQGQPQMDPRQMAAEGGIMNLGGMEKDYRAEGGFVAIGGKEKADDVPARLSRNEFVFTADAVRNAGGGDIDAGAKVMENMMENLEAGGQISEESQGGGGEEMISEEEIVEGPNGAQEMYDQQQMLQSRMG
jgi:hypothetical protein|tara:strand:+ start:85 stop:1815 length:1731 start_codon:yes stop_codon:yes gene_type:complete